MDATYLVRITIHDVVPDKPTDREIEAAIKEGLIALKQDFDSVAVKAEHTDQ